MNLSVRSFEFRRAALSSNPTLRRVPLATALRRYGPGTLYGKTAPFKTNLDGRGDDEKAEPPEHHMSRDLGDRGIQGRHDIRQRDADDDDDDVYDDDAAPLRTSSPPTGQTCNVKLVTNDTYRKSLETEFITLSSRVLEKTLAHTHTHTGPPPQRKRNTHACADDVLLPQSTKSRFQSRERHASHVFHVYAMSVRQRRRKINFVVAEDTIYLNRLLPVYTTDNNNGGMRRRRRTVNTVSNTIIYIVFDTQCDYCFYAAGPQTGVVLDVSPWTAMCVRNVDVQMCPAVHTMTRS
ncbi:unnamed protein product [Diatraea saccharalis]|uniref:Uncharacterized protein n=1 Tax=Diatraea saccharalis TaxID=40085 RepID=A0A9N9R5B0_9NEOP|nr:unnamed protein product [Diatraea saccharalis]